jgi:hypothetical protein
LTEGDIRQLLYRRESETLDFNAISTPLPRPPTTIANASRSTPAYILIGVDEKPQPTIVGIPESSHFKDHELQQFVNSKTNDPVRFGYERVLFGGLHVGALVVDHPHQRPIFLTKNYGHLKAGIVYLRYGSTGEAAPDELPAMRRAEAQAQVTPRFALELAYCDREERLGHDVEVTCVRLEVRSPVGASDIETARKAITRGSWTVPPCSLVPRTEGTKSGG